MKQAAPSKSKAQMKQTEKPSGNLFPYGAIKNTPQIQQGGAPEVKQAIGAKKQPSMSSAPKAAHPAPGAKSSSSENESRNEMASEKKKLSSTLKSIQDLFKGEE